MTRWRLKRKALVVVQACRRSRNVGSVVAGVRGAIDDEGSSRGSRFRVVSAGDVGRVAITVGGRAGVIA
jgi:hypothetical protein